MADDDRGVVTKIALSVVVVILMVPGLVIEPGPISEIVGLGALASIWGVDLLGDDDDEDSG